MFIDSLSTGHVHTFVCTRLSLDFQSVYRLFFLFLFSCLFRSFLYEIKQLRVPNVERGRTLK